MTTQTIAGSQTPSTTLGTSRGHPAHFLCRRVRVLRRVERIHAAIEPERPGAWSDPLVVPLTTEVTSEPTGLRNNRRHRAILTLYTDDTALEQDQGNAHGGM